MQNSMVIFILFVLDWKYHFWTNMVQKIKIVSLSWNLGPLLIRICRIQWQCFFICFRPKTPFLGKFDPNNQTCQFKLKYGTYTNSNMQNSMVMLTFSVSEQNTLFLANLVQKIKIVSLSWSFTPRLIPICRIQWRCSLFLFYIGNTLFDKGR